MRDTSLRPTSGVPSAGARLIGLLLVVTGLYIVGTPVGAAADGPHGTAISHRPVAQRGVRALPAERRWVRGDASANRAAFFACFGDSRDQCASDERDAMPPGWLAFVLVVCVLAGAVGTWYLGWTGMDAAADAIRDHRAGERFRTIMTWPAIAVLEIGWLVVFDDLAFGYALPRIGLGVNALAGVLLYPLYLAVLVLGLLIMIGYPVFVVGLLRSGARPTGRRLGLNALVVAILIGWWQIYLRVPAVAAGPFEVRTAWLNDALHTWTLQWPITVLWQTLRFLATPGGIVAFGCLALISGVLPDRRWPGRGMPSRAVLGVVHGTVINAAALITGTAMTVVVGIIAFAVLALALAFLAAYAIYYMLAAVITGAMISWLVRR